METPDRGSFANHPPYEARFRAVFESSRDAIGVSKRGVHLFVNPAYRTLFGFRPDEDLAGVPVLDLIAPECREQILENIARRSRGEAFPAIYETRGLRRDGTAFAMEVSSSTFREHGDLLTLVILRDVGARKQAEEEIAERGAMLQQIMDTASVAIFLVDKQGRITVANKRMAEMFGCAMEELAGSEYVDHVHPSERETGRAKMLALLASAIPAVDLERRYWRQDGTEFWGHLAGRRFHDVRGEEIGLIGVITDITERKRLEFELLKSEKLKSIGTLAGGIAHDFNNLLQGVFGFISMARLTLDRPEKALAMLEKAENALQRTVSLTSQLLTFSQGGAPMKLVIDLRPVIESAVHLALSGSDLDFRLSLADDLHPVAADEGQIEQALQNIVLNADQAMPKGGRIEIAARNASSPPAGGSLPAAGPQVEIVVRDSGSGILPEHLPQIFDPYFTTRERGRGLGLATAYSIVRNHGGTIEVASEPGRGSTFTVRLPAAARVSESPPPSREPGGSRCGRVLLMDDEILVREVAAELLAALGNEAEFAADGDAALAKFREARDAGRPFDIVILDLTIRGGMGGLETVRKLREIDPAVKAVVSSGYSEDGGIADFRRQGFVAFLKKPYTLAGLRALLSDLMA